MKFLRVTISIFVMAIGLQTAYGQDGPPFTATDLASERAVDTSADAEALFWDIHIEQTESKTVLSHYIRIKIFTDRGVESQGRVDLPYGGRNSIKDITARTIQPDGTVIGLKPDAIFERTLVKAKKVKLQAKSFALPSVKPGVLMDYRWTEVLHDIDSFHLPLPVQRDIPVQLVRFTIKPLPGIPLSLKVTAFNVESDPELSHPDKRGNQSGSVRSVPPFHEEPGMPPESAVRAWLLIYYAYGDFWLDYNRYLYESVKSRMRITDDIRREAASLLSKASTPEEKLRRLYEFCRSEIRRIDDDAGEDPVQRAADLAKENKTPSDTLKRKAGTARDIDFLFAALASAAGFDARYSVLSDRGRFSFNPRYPTPHMLVSSNIAVRLNDQWRFFDPAGRYLPFGMLRWQEEGIPALLVDSSGSEFVTTPVSSAERSLLKRSITGRLEADGTLEGDVRLVFFGHTGAQEKEALDGRTSNGREEYIKKAIQGRISEAEISNVEVQNVLDREQPVVESYHVRIPGYAQRIGRRLFFEPGYFQHGRAPMLTASTRIHPIYFHYPWTEDDIVVIDLPQGFTLDNADQPPHEAAADTTIKHEMHIGITEDGRTLRYLRRLSFGIDEKIFFPPSEYPLLKSVLDALGERDAHKIAIREMMLEGEKR